MPVAKQDLVQCLRKGLPSTTRHGQSTVLDPESPLWAFASEPYNTRLSKDIAPLLIVYPSTPAEISVTLHCAQLSHVPVVARSGGHSYAAYSLGGALSSNTTQMSDSSNNRSPEQSVVVDMRSFNTLHYSPHTEVITVGSGVLLGEMNNYLEAFGRMLPTGSCPTVGVGGQVLAGGFGGSSRSAGLFLDNLLEMEVVLADGERHTISGKNKEDLYWGMRGAGSSLAIAHTFRLRTHPVPPSVMYFELTLLPRALPPTPESISRATAFYAAFEDFGGSSDSTKEMGMFAWHVTPEPGAEGWGTKVEVLGQFFGTEEEFGRVMRKFEERLQDVGERQYHLGKRPLTFLQSMHQVGGNWTRLEDRGPLNINEHVNFYAKSLLTKKPLTSAQTQPHLSRLLSHSPTQNPSTGLDWFVLSPFLGGPHSEITKVPQEATAFGHRDLRVVWELYAKIPETVRDSQKGQERDLVGFVKGMAEHLLPVEAVYPAYVDPELDAALYPSMVYGPSYKRLQTIKQKYDPHDLFRYPQSVRLPDAGYGLIHLLFVGALLLGLGYILRRRYRIRAKKRNAHLD